VKEMKTICFQANQINDGLIHRLDVKFQIVPTFCTSQLSLEVIVKHIETLYDELIKKFNQANDGIISPMAQLHNDSVYTLSGIHMLETVAKPMLQMLEIQRENSSKKVQYLQAKLDRLSLGVNNECFCDGTTMQSDDGTTEQSDDGTTMQSDDVEEIVSPPPLAPKKKKEKKSSMVSSPV